MQLAVDSEWSIHRGRVQARLVGRPYIRALYMGPRIYIEALYRALYVRALYIGPYIKGPYMYFPMYTPYVSRDYIWALNI